MNLEILDKFTTHLKNTLADAVQLAMKRSDEYVRPYHLLMSMAGQRGSIGAELLEKNGFNTEQERQFQAAAKIINEETSVPLPEFSDPSKALIEHAALLSSKFQHKYIGTEHLLKSFLDTEDPEEDVAQAWKRHRIKLKQLQTQLEHVLKSTSKFPDLNDVFQNDGLELRDEFADSPFSAPASSPDEGFPPSSPSPMAPGMPPQPHSQSKTPALEFFCKDLTQPKIQEGIDPVIGRDEEIERVIHILSRRTKNNPILIGEPGVGKTAIAEGLAKRIVEKQVPQVLANKRIMSLDLSLVVAGTIYRGEFEGRFKQILEEMKNNPNIILFIDEIHNIVGAGGTTGGGTLDAANILKPALSKGDVRCIGATTLTEFKKYIEADTALERRFQPVFVDEPSSADAVEILKGLKSRYEEHHHVEITNEAVKAAVELSVRYIPDKHLPDKAIDLIDEAAARMRANQPFSPSNRDEDHLSEEMSTVKNEKDEAVMSKDFDRALHLKHVELSLQKRIASVKTKSKIKKRQQPIGMITEKEIIEGISRVTKIPLKELHSSDKQRLLHIEEHLGKWVIGQEEAVRSIASFIRRSHAGLSGLTRPIGSFLFLGPSGVGKTHLAKMLAKSVYQDEKALIRIDMSEFNESFSISKLIGAPAGYVGYRESTKLTDLVKRRPYSVVLFDEIEKAHPDVFNLLLQVLDDGRLTDATGREINFRNTIIIMTSNIGLHELNKGASIGFVSKHSKDGQEAQDEFNQASDRVIEELHHTLPPEFVNRLDSTIVFRPLSLKEVTKIAELQMQDLIDQMKLQNLHLTVSKEALKYIAKEGYKPTQGARGVRRVIQNQVETPLAKQILGERITKGDRVHIGIQDKKLLIGRID